MDKVQKLRWRTLEKVNFPYSIVLKSVKEEFGVDVIETNLSGFLKKIDEYSCIDNNKLLSIVEKYAFKKLLIFSLREKELEELTNEVFKEDFKNRNMLRYVLDKEDLTGIDEDMKCVYFHESGKYITIKMAQIKTVEVEELEESGRTVYRNIEYYDFVKFIVDMKDGIMFMFFNDVNSILRYDLGNNKSCTYKKSCFYGLFASGTQFSLSKYSIDEELNDYVKNILDKIDINNEEFCISKNIPVIETEDPIDSKNNLRSSKRDSRHNIYRLQAINYALKNEEHNIKMMECEINKRMIIFKNTGEILLQIPFFGMEVITDVCKEIFPQYTLLSDYNEATGTDNQ